jgi:hypothetical protein
MVSRHSRFGDRRVADHAGPRRVRAKSSPKHSLLARLSIFFLSTPSQSSDPLCDRHCFATAILSQALSSAPWLSSLFTLALQPPYLQDLMNYPVLTAGLVMGTMVATMLVGRFVGKVDTRWLLAIGLGLSAWSFYVMTGWTPDVSEQGIITAGSAQRRGLRHSFCSDEHGYLIDGSLRKIGPKGASVFSLSRSLGSSVGISIFSALLTTNTEINHADISANVTAVNRAFEDPRIAHFLSPFTPRPGEQPSMRWSRSRRRSSPTSMIISCCGSPCWLYLHCSSFSRSRADRQEATLWSRVDGMGAYSEYFRVVALQNVIPALCTTVNDPAEMS